MLLSASQSSLPSPTFTANQITFNENKFDDYPYLILALLNKLPQLRDLSDESITHYHNSVRAVLINKYREKQYHELDT